MEAKAILKGNNYHFPVTVGKHTFMVDEPVEKGGTDQAPGPIDLILASLVSCTSITVSMYAKTKGIALESVEVSVDGSLEAGTSKLQLQRFIKFNGNLTEAEKDRLLGIANRCPVHKILSQQNDIVTTLV